MVSAMVPMLLAVVSVVFTVPPALPDLGYAAEVVRIVDITGTLITSLFRIRAERTAAGFHSKVAGIARRCDHAVRRDAFFHPIDNLWKHVEVIR